MSRSARAEPSISSHELLAAFHKLKKNDHIEIDSKTLAHLFTGFAAYLEAVVVVEAAKDKVIALIAAKRDASQVSVDTMSAEEVTVKLCSELSEAKLSESDIDTLDSISEQFRPTAEAWAAAYARFDVAVRAVFRENQISWPQEDLLKYIEKQFEKLPNVKNIHDFNTRIEAEKRIVSAIAYAVNILTERKKIDNEKLEQIREKLINYVYANNVSIGSSETFIFKAINLDKTRWQEMQREKAENFVHVRNAIICMHSLFQFIYPKRQMMSFMFKGKLDDMVKLAKDIGDKPADLMSVRTGHIKTEVAIWIYNVVAQIEKKLSKFIKKNDKEQFYHLLNEDLDHHHSVRMCVFILKVMYARGVVPINTKFIDLLAVVKPLDESATTAPYKTVTNELSKLKWVRPQSASPEEKYHPR